MTVSNYEYQTVIRVLESKRSDTGIYELTAKNVNGTDRATCKVTVLDVPGPPEGPVGTKDVRKESATISWNIPKDDGGSPNDAQRYNNNFLISIKKASYAQY